MIPAPPVEDSRSMELDSSAGSVISEITVGDVLASLWRLRWLGTGLTALTLFAGVVFLHFATFKYSAESILTSADQGAMKSNISSLGSLVGLDIGGQQGSGFSMFGTAVISYPVAEELSHDSHIMRAVFNRDWDARNDTWRAPQSSIRPLIHTLKYLLGFPVQTWHRPDASDLKLYIEKNVSVTEDKKKQTVTISYQHQSREFAVYFTRRLTRAADNFLRTKALSLSTQYIRYLELRLSQVQVAEYRESLSSILGNYEKTRMMASSGAPFAGDPFGDVWISPMPTSPQPLVILGLSFGSGLILWLTFSFALIRKARDSVGAGDA